MDRINLLDCTLRDGAYLIDKEFGNNTIQGIVEGLVDSGVEIIEIGFFQNEGFGEGKTVFKNSADASRFIPSDKKQSKFAVLADYSRYDISNLDEQFEGGIDFVRECFFKNERFDALNVCKEIKRLGYGLFIQPVDILGYTDKELLEFIELVNEVEPYCISIVDTFGSMYVEDLKRVFELLNHNLVSTCRIGFHSHNNMQLSNALSQEFVRISEGKRVIVVDSTLSGMGRGAGNTPTELITQYLVEKHKKHYNMDKILDLIDVYIDNFRYRCKWGYETGYFVAGCYSAHVNNIAYLKQKSSIKSKDIRLILNIIGAEKRKRYDYNLLEQEYLNLLKSDIDDTKSINEIKEIIGSKEVLILASGNSVVNDKDLVTEYIEHEKPIVISVNYVNSDIKSDLVYMSNKRRYEFWKNDRAFIEAKKIMTSNFDEELADSRTYYVSYLKLLKCGWESMDNSTITLLRLLKNIGVKKISIAGMDGYSDTPNYKNYYSENMELESVVKNALALNEDIASMLRDFYKNECDASTSITFVTHSRFEKVLE